MLSFGYRLKLRWGESSEPLEGGDERVSRLESHTVANRLDGKVGGSLHIVHPLAGLLDAIVVDEGVEVGVALLVDDLRHHLALRFGKFGKPVNGELRSEHLLRGLHH